MLRRLRNVAAVAAFVAVLSAPASASAAASLQGTTLDFLQGNSKIREDGDLRLETDGTMWIGASHLLHVSNALSVGGALQIRNNGGGFAGSQMYDDGALHIQGNSQGGIYLDNATTIQGKLTVNTGGAAITGNTSIDGTLTGLTGLTVASGGATVTAGGLTVTAGTISLPAASIADAALSSNVPLKNGANTFSANQVVNGTLTGLTGLTVASGGATVTAGGLTVTAGGLTVSGGGAAITGNSTVTGTLTGLTGLTVASGGATVTAGGLTVTAGTTTLGDDLRQAGATSSATYNAPAVNTLGTATASVGDLLYNRVILHSAGANDTITTPTAAALVAALPGTAAVGDTFSFLLSNSAAANTATLAGGTGVTITGTAALPAATSKMFFCRATNVTASSEAFTCY